MIVTKDGWLTGSLPDDLGFKIEHDEIPRPGGKPYLPLVNPAGCLHTTEGVTVDGAIAVNRAKGFGSHFYIGQDRIVQTRPLTAQASSLVNHNDRFIQIEMVWEVGKHPLLPPYLPTAPTLEPLLHMMGHLREHGIPLARPFGWHDNMSDVPLPWAADNSRRKSRRALTFDGWVGHIEVPDQAPTWHYDPGAFNWTAAFDLIQAIGGDMSADQIQGSQDQRNGKPLKPGQSADYVWAYHLEERIANAAKTPAPGAAAPHKHSFAGETGTG